MSKHPAWLGKAMQSGGRALAGVDSQPLAEKAGWLDKGASMASKLIRGGKPAAKSVEDTGGATGQRMRDLMAKGKTFEEAHQEVHPEMWKSRDQAVAKYKNAIEANKAAEAAGKPYPSEEWKALFPTEKKRGGRAKSKKG